MGLCSSSETTDDTRSRTGSATVMDEENIVTAEAVKQNEELRKKDHVRRASLLKHGDLRTPSGTPIPIPEHVQGMHEEKYLPCMFTPDLPRLIFHRSIKPYRHVNVSISH